VAQFVVDNVAAADEDFRGRGALDSPYASSLLNQNVGIRETCVRDSDATAFGLVVGFHAGDTSEPIPR